MKNLGLAETVADVIARTGFRVGIHCQDDTGCAVANTLAAVEAGVTHVQGTANGYGERAGNADTFSLIGNLVTKMGLPVVPAECLPELQRVSHAIAELANIAPDDHQPFVGASAFAHKAGLHASAIKVDPSLYQHMDPVLVGNDMRLLVSDMAGRASIELKGKELGHDLTVNPQALNLVGAGVTWRQRVWPILQSSCGGCHGGSNPQAGLDMLSDGAWTRLRGGATR